jgi:hypothetical protein
MKSDGVKWAPGTVVGAKDPRVKNDLAQKQVNMLDL